MSLGAEPETEDAVEITSDRPAAVPNVQAQSLMQMIMLYNQAAQFGLSQAPVAASAINASQPPPESTTVPQPTITPSPSLSTPSPGSATAFSQDYEVLIHIEAKPKPGSRKNAKPEIKVFEPRQLSPQLGWDDFLSQLAAILNVTKAALKISRMRYRWSKPKSSTDIPLISEDGYSLMIKNLLQLGKKVSEGGFKVIVTMDPPEVIDPMKSSDEPEEEEDRPRKVPGRLDTRLQTMMMELEEMYHDKCDVHKPLTCFHYRRLDLHFILTDDRKKVWANAILLGTAGKTLPPLSSNYFSAAQATPVKKVKGDKSEASTAPPPSPTPAPHLSREQPFLPMYPPMQAIPYAMPFPMYHPSMAMPSPYYPGFFPPHNPGDTLHVQGRSEDRSSSPTTGGSSPPPPPEASVEEMCALFNLGDDFMDRLALLKFQIGDDLSSLPEEKWRYVGFEDLEWNRLLKAYRRYKKRLHN